MIDRSTRHPHHSPALPVDRILARLSLREKVAQLVMPWISGAYVARDSTDFDTVRRWVVEDRIGGLIISMGTPLAYAARLDDLQRLAEVPLLITSDMENGAGMRLGGIFSLPHLIPQGGATVFPPLMALGATRSPELAFELARVMAIEARAVGVHMTFGPVLDVNSNPSNPIINTRAFGESPELVARLATAYIEGARSGGLLTTGKHFPGHGDTYEDSHLVLPTVAADRARLDRVELPPFQRAIEAGVDAIMTAHIAMVGVEGENAPPATLSPYFMTRVLREEMRFDGLLFTDGMTMAGVARRYGVTESLLLALEAGADVLLMPHDVPGAIDAVVEAVETGRLTEARIDDSVRRLLEAKDRAGLAAGGRVPLERVSESVGSRAHVEVARTIAERSITLVRDESDLVPLPRAHRRIASIVYASPADLVAGRAFDAALRAAGLEVSSGRLDERSTPDELRAAHDIAATADAVVVSIYVAPVIEGESTVRASGAFTGWVADLAASGAPFVTISFGSPYLLATIREVPTYLLAWGGAGVSQRAAARALLGHAAITGRSPVSVPPHFPIGAGIPRPTLPEEG